MPKSIEVARGLTVKYEEVFNLKKLYVYIWNWLREKGYLNDETEKWMETYYLDKTTPAGKELWIWWRTNKSDENQYIQFKLNIDYHVMTLDCLIYVK